MTKRQTYSIDSNLPALLRRDAKRLSREDKSRTYQQHLECLAKTYGFSYEGLLTHLSELKRAAIDAAEATRWSDRFRNGMVWGTPPQNEEEYSMMLPVAQRDRYPLAYALVGLFGCGEGPREQCSHWISSVEEPITHYQGEELRISVDDMIFAGLVMCSRGKRFGEVISLTLTEFETELGCRLEDCGIPVSPAEIPKTLWRLAHSVVTVPTLGFEGPLLQYVDATHAPERISYRFHPDIARLYYNPFAYSLLQAIGSHADPPHWGQ